MELCNPDFTPKLTAKSLAESRAEYLLNSFGQIFYSQFIGMYKCIIPSTVEIFVGQHKFAYVVMVAIPLCNHQRMKNFFSCSENFMNMYTA